MKLSSVIPTQPGIKSISISSKDFFFKMKRKQVPSATDTRVYVIPLSAEDTLTEAKNAIDSGAEKREYWSCLSIPNAPIRLRVLCLYS